MHTKAISPTYAQYLLSQQDLFSRILHFNHDFHARQRELMAQKPAEEISDTLFNLHPELAQFHSEHNISYCFDNAVDRLCLVRLNELDQLVVYLGACIIAPQLARVSGPEDLNTVYAQIGRKIYNFALDYGYLIKSFEYEPDLNSLKDDCTYLGLCALKCLNSLFSSQELKDYFLQLLTNFTRSRNLDPAIITAETHILSVVDNTADPLQPPSPIQMNTPVQYTAIDLHPSLDKHTPHVSKNAAQQQNTSTESESAPKIKPTLGLEITKPTLYEPEPQRQLYAPYAQVPSKIPVGAIVKSTPSAPEQVPLSSVPAALSAADTQAEDKATTTEASEAPELPAATTSPEASPSQETTTVETTPPQAPEAQRAEAAAATDDYSDLPPTVGAPLPPDYTRAALYGSMNSKDRRVFRSASLHQQNVHQELLREKGEPQALVHNQLVTLEFNATQVFTLTKLILESQIDEHWYDYLI